MRFECQLFLNTLLFPSLSKLEQSFILCLTNCKAAYTRYYWNNFAHAASLKTKVILLFNTCSSSILINFTNHGTYYHIPVQFMQFYAHINHKFYYRSVELRMSYIDLLLCKLYFVVFFKVCT